MKIAVPHFGEDVAPCFEYSACIAIFTIRGNRVVDQMQFCLQSREAFDRVRLLRDQRVATLICGGVQDSFEDLLEASGIRVISWVTGNVHELLELFIQGRLEPGTARLGGTSVRSVVANSAGVWADPSDELSTKEQAWAKSEATARARRSPKGVRREGTSDNE